MFGRVINKVGLVANNQNSAYYQLHNTISEYTNNIKNRDTTVFDRDIHNTIFTNSLKNGGLSNEDIRYMKVYNRNVSK